MSKRVVKPDADTLQKITEWTEAGVPKAEQAKMLGLSVNALLYRMRWMDQNGYKLVRAHMDLTPKQEGLVADLRYQGYPVAEVARRLKLHVSALARLCRIKGYTRNNVTSFKGRDLARVMGLPEHIIYRWLKLKALKAEKLRKQEWHIAEKDVRLFMEKRDFWPEWYPHLIQHSSLKAYAYEVRDGETKLLSTAGVAVIHEVSQCTVQRWISQGKISSIKTQSGHLIYENEARSFVRPPSRFNKQNATRQ